MYLRRLHAPGGKLCPGVPLLFLLLLLVGFPDAGSAQTQVLFGDQAIEGEHDSNAAGTAEAFQTTATAAGTLSTINLYIDSGSSAANVSVGLYADNAGNAGTLLTQGTLSSPPAGWNAVSVAAVNVVSGTKYWIAVLGVDNSVNFRDRSSGPCISESNSAGNLSALPAKWTPGTKYTDCPLSAYGTGAAAPPPPTLALSTQTVNLTSVVGGTTISSTVDVSNSGTGTLDFSAVSDANWLTVAPLTGAAPASLMVSADPSGLPVGTYVGHVTVSSPGSQNSPQSITVNLSVTASVPPNQPGDWLTVEHDPARLGFAADETALSPANASTLVQRWTRTVDGYVTAQPLFAAGIPIGGQNHDVVIAATSGNSVYALDAATGAVLWQRNLGSSQTANCVYPNGFGVSGAPTIDRARQRVYAVSSQGTFYSLSLLDGTVASKLPGLIPNPGTNNVWGGLNQNDKYVYLASGSDGCDDQPWAGFTYKIDVSSGVPVQVAATQIVPNGGNDAGGAIWGYGGMAVDIANGNVYGATAADVTSVDSGSSGSSGYANHMVAFDANLRVLGSYAPSDPITYPCSSAPCDLDFASTPLVFQPPACPQLAVAGKKNGNIYLFRTADLAASQPPLQTLQLNVASDFTGSGGVAGTGSYWPAGNMVFFGTAGPGANGVAGGIVALNVTGSCTLTPAWSHALGSGQPNSTVTVANGVALIGVGTDGTVHAFDAASGTELWKSAGFGSTYAAPMVANGSVYYGSWGASGSNSGRISAYWLNGAPPPNPILALSATTLTFNEVQGGAVPAAQTVSLSNSGTGTLSFTTQSDATWLTVTPASGNAPATLSVSVAALSAGSYTGHITVTASGAAQSPQTITVNLTVTTPPPPNPVLQLSTTSLSFSDVQGGALAPAQSVSVSNAGSGSLGFVAQSDAAWLTVTPASGNAPATLSVGVTAQPAGTYTGHITVTAAGAANSPQSITVTLTVSPATTSTLLLGTKTLESQRDSNRSGQAEAFQATAAASGTTGSIVFYLDSTSTVAKVTIGIYIDAGGHPGSLLAQVATTTPKAGAWNTLAFPAQTINAGQHYWIAILGIGSGTIRFRDQASGCSSETSTQTTLTALPAAWSSGTRYTDCPLSAYALSQ